MPNLIKKIIYIFLFFIVSLNANESQNIVPLQKISLQLQWKYQFQFAGFIVAKEKGYYKEAGLDVNIMEYNNTNLIDDLMSSKVDFIVNNSTLIYKNKKLLPVTMLASYFQRSPLILVTQPKIKRVLDLKGKTIMLSPDDLKYSPISRLLEHFGLNTKNTNFIEQTFSLDSFIDKKVDALAIFSSNEIYTLENKNISYNIIDPVEYGFSTNAINLFTTHKMLKENPELINKFLKANKKGWKYALDNIDEVIKLINNKYNSKTDLKTLKFEAQETKKLMMSNLYDIGSINYEFVKNTYNRLVKNGTLLDNQDMSKIVYKHDYSFNETINISEILKIIFIMTLIIVLFLLGKYMYQKQKSLKLEYTLQSQMIEQVNDSIISTDLQGNILNWNNGSQKMLGYAQEEVVGKHMSIIHREEDIEQNKEYAIRLQKEGSFSVEAYLVTKEKKEIYVAVTLSLLKDSDGLVIGLLGVSKDISIRKKMEDELQIQKDILDWKANHDYLTSLPNRVLFYDRLNQSIKQAKRDKHKLALFFLDLDHFKEVNDTFGHEVGDLLLKHVSSTMKAIIRNEDTLSRLGGDEFTIIVKNLSIAQDAQILAQKIVDFLSQPLEINGHKINISCSLGISIYPQDAIDYENLIKCADDAMYKAKANGKNNFQYYSI